MPPDPARLDAVFKAYDVRGVVPDQLDADLVRAVGAAFAEFARGAGGPAHEILVARDMRPSGVELASAFADGVRHQGVGVVDLGLCSTDELFFATGHYDAPGVILTASHNPAQYNGMKLALAGARPVGADTGLADIRRRAAAGLEHADVAGTIRQHDALPDFVAHVHELVEPSSLAPLKVVADAANGMGGLIAPAVFADLPVELDLMYGELDGTFPNHPADPIDPANLADLRERVRTTGADLGLAFDGDADRVFLVDDRAEPVSGSTTTAIVAASMLERYPGATVLYNAICSRAVPEVIRERGGTPVRTRVGHSFIKQVMAETDAVFGGEHSGHYYFRDNYRADSGIIAALAVMAVMSAAGEPLSALRQPFERYAASGERNTPVGDAAGVMDGVAAHFADHDQDRLDGLTVDVGEWWFNLRPSNTEPLLRLNVEAPDQASCDRHTERLRSLIQELDPTAGGAS